MSPTSTTTGIVSGEALLPGYFVDEKTGAWLTLPRFPFGDVLTIGPWVLDWCEGRLHHHLTGDPWEFTPGQVNFVLWWYALRGPGPDMRWLYPSGVRRGAKGTGKDPLLAALMLVELCGPTRPVWDGGKWVGERYRRAKVQIAANSERQAKEPLSVANALVDRDMAMEFGFDKGILRTQVEGGSRIEVLTSSEASAEGDPATAIFLNESHHMTESSGGQRMAAVARRNVAKSPIYAKARVCEFTNCHMPGQASVAEDSFEAWQKQVQRGRVTILYDSREAPPHLRPHVPEELEEGIRAAYADSPWSDLEGLREEAEDFRVSVADTIRFYFNSLPTNEDAWINPRKFDALARPDEILVDAEAIALFLDCSKSTDSTTLAGCRISDGHSAALGCWQRPRGGRGLDWLAPREGVDARVREAFDRYAVQWFGVDPSPARDDETEALYWAEVIDKWHQDFRNKVLLWATPGEKLGNAVLFDFRQSKPGGRERLREFTAEAERTAQAIDHDGTMTWDGDSIMRLHVHNARRRPNEFGIGLGKQSRDSKKLVDYAVSMVGARLGRRIVLNSGKKLKGKRTGKAMF